jgi:hypothetical protein
MAVSKATYGTSEVYIPKWVKTDPTDVCMRVDQLRVRMEGKRVFMMLHAGNFDVEMIACRSMKDVAFYANYYRVFTASAKPEDRMVLFGNVYKAEVLPFALSETALEREAFFIYDDFMFGRSASVAALAYKIEDIIKERNADISRFVVILGRQSKTGVRDKMNTAVARYSDRSLWREDKWALTDVNIP